MNPSAIHELFPISENIPPPGLDATSSGNTAATGSPPAESDNALPTFATAILSARRPRSCVTCRRRKVKCDKAVPCANCVRHGVACVFPPPGRARPRPSIRGAQTSERILTRDPRGLEARPTADQTAVFVAKERPAMSELELDGKILGREQWIDRWWYLGERLPRRFYRFHATHPPLNLEEEVTYDYTSYLLGLSELLCGADDYISDDDNEDIEISSGARNFDPAERFSQELPTPFNDHLFALGVISSDSNLSSKHPSPSQIPFYWQIFVENVNPLFKIFHIPTLSKMVRGIPGRIRSLSPPEEALIFAIYFAAVTSMAPEEVRELLGQDKVILVTQYRRSTEQALARAEFMISTNLMTLQAFVLFLCCLRQHEQPRFTWNLTALAVRIAQGIGLQRVSPKPQLSPYDLETRKRLWVCLWLLDLETALELEADWLIADEDIGVGLPLNINDSDLDPEGIEYPTSRTGMTDMSHVLVKYEIGCLLKRIRAEQGREGPISPQPRKQESMESIVAACRDRMEEHYLRHCADDDPLQWLTAAIARLFFATAPLLIFHPVLSSELRSSISTDVRNRLVATSTEVIECSHVLETMASPRCRGWLFGTYLHWHALALILETLHLPSHETTNMQRSWNAMELASSLWATSPRLQPTEGPWCALIKLVDKAKRKREANLGDGRARFGTNVADSQLPQSASSPIPDSHDSNDSLRHELDSVLDDSLVVPNPNSRIVGTAQTTSFQTSPACLESGGRFILDGSYSASEVTDNLAISEGSFSTNPTFPGLWPFEYPQTMGRSWGASEQLTENSVNMTEDWTVWDDLVHGSER